MKWRGLRSRFPVRANFGQWLRWEAALEEIRGLSRGARPVSPDGLDDISARRVERIIASSPSLRLLPPQPSVRGTAVSTMKNWHSRRSFRSRSAYRRGALSLDDCRKIYRALARDSRRQPFPLNARGDRGEALPDRSTRSA